ncbi:MAG: ClbS/DfsB family four-helix bundle protein [Anaerolineales bacterium]
MSRPTGKKQLVAAMQTEHDALEKTLAALTEEQISAVNRSTQWSIKDVLAHLTEWERMVTGWYEAGRKGKTPAVPSEKYNWAQLPALNKEIFDKHHNRTVREVCRRYRASFAKILDLVNGISEAELFTRGRYAWTNKNALAAYFIGCTSSHYVWARKEIRKCLK